MTKGQMRELQKAADSPIGVVESPINRPGFARQAWRNMMERAAEAGLCKRYVHGGYEITDAGRKAVVRT